MSGSLQNNTHKITKKQVSNGHTDGKWESTISLPLTNGGNLQTGPALKGEYTQCCPSCQGKSPNGVERIPSPCKFQQLILKWHQMWTEALDVSWLQRASHCGWPEPGGTFPPRWPEKNGLCWLLRGAGKSLTQTGPTHHRHRLLGGLPKLLVLVHVPKPQWGQTTWNTRVWSREILIAEPCNKMGGSCPPNIPNPLNQNCKAFWKAKWGRAVAVSEIYLVQISFVPTAVHRGQVLRFL